MLRIEMFHPMDARRSAFDRLGEPAEVEGTALCLLVWRYHHVVARCSLEVVDEFVDGGLVGVVGHYEASEREAALLLLEEVKKRALAKGVLLLVGPMNGSVWGEHGFALPHEVGERTFQPPFFAGEPCNDTIYPRYWEESGFIVIASYRSVICTQLYSALGESREEMLEIVAMDADRKQQQLLEVYYLLVEQLRADPFYRPCDYETFVQRQEAGALLDPGRILLAYREGQLEGFCWAYEDRNDRSRLVVRWLLASDAEVRRVLLEKVHRLAYGEGYQALIHAMLPEASLLLELIPGETFRRYALYGYPLP